MRVLSLFDGMSCGQLALQNARQWLDCGRNSAYTWRNSLTVVKPSALVDSVLACNY